MEPIKMLKRKTHLINKFFYPCHCEEPDSGDEAILNDKIASPQKQGLAMTRRNRRNFEMKRNFLSVIFLTMVIAVGMRAEIVSAATYDIKELTPSVKAALDGRRNRFDQLRALKEKGLVGENNRGYVEALGDDPQAKTIVDEENNDRRFIYKTIVEQNNLSPDAISTIETVFAQVQRDKANPGDKIQDAGGSWIKK